MVLPIAASLMSTSNSSSIINRSLRFRGSSYLTRTVTTLDGSSNRWGWSVWVKRGKLSQNNPVIFDSVSIAWNMGIRFTSSDQLEVYAASSGGYYWQVTTTQLFRDTSAWYHFVIAIDTTKSVQTDRVRVYVNGTQVTSFYLANYPSLNLNIGTQDTATIAHYIGSGGVNFVGYLAEMHYIDGWNPTYPAPSYFGSYNSYGVWSPNYSVDRGLFPWGATGFYLNFSNPTSISTIGYDLSGNNNNFSVSGISMTPGITYDSMTDVPLPVNPDIGNYAVINPLVTPHVQLDDANLKVTMIDYNSLGFDTNCRFVSSIGVSSGKWYAEFICFKANTNAQVPVIGISNNTNPSTNITPNGIQFGLGAAGTYFTVGNTNILNASWSGTTTTWTSTDVAGLAVDVDNQIISLYKNGNLVGTPYSYGSSNVMNTGITYFAGGQYNPDSTYTVNFGQRPFAYTLPSGYAKLNSYNLSATIKNGAAYFAAIKYTGDGNSTKTIDNSVNTISFQPDLVIVKDRLISYNAVTQDSVRGVGQSKVLSITSNFGEAYSTSTYYGNVSNFNSNGFTVATGTTNRAWVNNLNDLYISWNWKAGRTTSTNSNGSISSTVSLNQNAGFSIVTFSSATSGSSYTVGHSLYKAPDMIVVKNLDQNTDWITYHSSLGNTKYMYLDLGTSSTTSSNVWNNTSPTGQSGTPSSVFTLGSTFIVSGTPYRYLAYCWTSVPGYSSFSSYTGNGITDGPFINCGFRPRFVMIKNSTTTNAWIIYDTERDTFNPATTSIPIAGSGSENSTAPIDILSNGFKIRSGSGITYLNASANVYIYAAFAENTFNYALAR